MIRQVAKAALLRRSGEMERYWTALGAYLKDPVGFEWEHGGHREFAEEGEALVAGIRESLASGSTARSGLPDAWLGMIADTYINGMDNAGRARFLGMLATEFGLDRSTVEVSLGKISLEQDNKLDLDSLARSVRTACTPLHEHIVRKMVAMPGGLVFVLRLRADVLAEGARMRRENLTGQGARARLHALNGLKTSLTEVLASVFSVGALELQTLSFKSPAATLEKVIDGEKVHPMTGWSDLKQRLGVGRRIFAFFHPALPLTPLVSVQVALTKGMASSVQDVLGASPTWADEAAATHAMFYSISASQPGLAGIELGNFLIKRVVSVLRSDCPQLSAFTTLSPVPGFADWLRTSLHAGVVTDGQNLLANHGGIPRLLSLLDKVKTPQEFDLNDLRQELEDVRPMLEQAVARYLVSEKRRGAALNGVAHFHIRNGASLARVNWMGNQNARGLRESCGIMVNYEYNLATLDENNAAYILDGTVRCSPEVARLLPHSS